MKLAVTLLLGSILVALGVPRPAPSPSASTATVSAAPELRHAQAAELLSQTRTDLLAAREQILSLQELAFEASNGTLNGFERMLLDLRFQLVQSQLGRLASTSRSNGIALLDGSIGAVELQVHPARPLLWNQQLPDCRPLTLGLENQDVTSAANAASAVTVCDTALENVASALFQVRVGAAVLGL